jgi:hypothetical protein
VKEDSLAQVALFELMLSISKSLAFEVEIVQDGALLVLTATQGIAALLSQIVLVLAPETPKATQLILLFAALVQVTVAELRVLETTA